MTLKNPCSGKQCSWHSNGLKCVAASGSSRGTECENGVTSELLAEEENDIKNGCDNNILIIFLVYNSLRFLTFSYII